MLEDATLTGVNVVGLSAFSSYLMFYYAMSSNRNRISIKILSMICILTIIVLMCSSRAEDGIYWSAMSACTSSLISCASPLAGVRRVFRSKSCESLPFAFILFSFLNSFFWSWYGFLAGNNFIILPNAAGGVIALFQLTLFCLYPSSRSGKKQHKMVRHQIFLCTLSTDTGLLSQRMHVLCNSFLIFLFRTDSKVTMTQPLLLTFPSEPVQLYPFLLFY